MQHAWNKHLPQHQFRRITQRDPSCWFLSALTFMQFHKLHILLMPSVLWHLSVKNPSWHSICTLKMAWPHVLVHLNYLISLAFLPLFFRACLLLFRSLPPAPMSQHTVICKHDCLKIPHADNSFQWVCHDCKRVRLQNCSIIQSYTFSNPSVTSTTSNMPQEC